MTVDVFQRQWLELREPVDHRSRNASVMSACAAWCNEHSVRRAIDLGAGTGSNARYLRPRLAMIEDWLLIDNDERLLSEAKADFDTKAMNLMALSSSEEIEHSGLITGSALLDLVNASWLRGLVLACQRQGAAILFTLNVDGRIAFEPPLTEDKLVLNGFKEDQDRDKGMGTALGITAPNFLQGLLLDHGYYAVAGDADWNLGPADNVLQEEYLRGLVDAVHMAVSDRATTTDDWLRQRLDLNKRGLSQITVGHIDIFAAPAGG